MKLFRLFRSIVLNEGEVINTNNIGNSWTLCEVFAEHHANDYNRFAGKDGYVILAIDVSLEDVDLDNTLFSMENREYEFEVVINDLDVEAEIHEVQGIDTYEKGDILNANTGSDYFEDYCVEYEGDLVVADLIKLINDFE